MNRLDKRKWFCYGFFHWHALCWFSLALFIGCGGFLLLAIRSSSNIAAGFMTMAAGFCLGAGIAQWLPLEKPPPSNDSE